MSSAGESSKAAAARQRASRSNTAAAAAAATAHSGSKASLSAIDTTTNENDLALVRMPTFAAGDSLAEKLGLQTVQEVVQYLDQLPEQDRFDTASEFAQALVQKGEDVDHASLVFYDLIQQRGYAEISQIEEEEAEDALKDLKVNADRGRKKRNMKNERLSRLAQLCNSELRGRALIKVAEVENWGHNKVEAVEKIWKELKSTGKLVIYINTFILKKLDDNGGKPGGQFVVRKQLQNKDLKPLLAAIKNTTLEPLEIDDIEAGRIGYDMYYNVAGILDERIGRVDAPTFADEQDKEAVQRQENLNKALERGDKVFDDLDDSSSDSNEDDSLPTQNLSPSSASGRRKRTADKSASGEPNPKRILLDPLQRPAAVSNDAPLVLPSAAALPVDDGKKCACNPFSHGFHEYMAKSSQPPAYFIDALRWMLKEAFPDREYIPCIWHLNRLCNGLKMNPFPAATNGIARSNEIMSGLRKVHDVWTKKGSSWERLLVDKSTTDLMKATDEELVAARQQLLLKDMRFFPKKVRTLPLQEIDAAKLIGRTVAEKFSVSGKGYHVARNRYTWLNTEARDALKEEVEMYAFHSRISTTEGKTIFFARETGVLDHMWYSLAQQLVRSDPQNYRYHYLMRRDRIIELYAFPQPARFFSKDAAANARYIQVDAELLKVGRANAIIDETLFCSDSHKRQLGIQIQPGLISATKSLVLKNGAGDHIDLRSLEWENGFRIALDDMGLSNTAWRYCDPGALGTLYRAGGAPIELQFTSDTDRLYVSSGLLARDPENPELMENGARFDELITGSLAQKVPVRGRFDDGVERPFTPFAAVVELSGLGLISDALVGRKSWSDSAVQLEAREFLQLTDKETEQSTLVTNFRANVNTNLPYLWSRIKKEEERRYPNGWVNWRKSEVIDLTADDEFNPPSSSDTEPESSAVVTPLPVPLPDKDSSSDENNEDDERLPTHSRSATARARAKKGKQKA